MIAAAILLGVLLSLPFWVVRWAVAWRLAVLDLLIAATLLLTSAPVGWQGQTLGYSLAMFFVTVMVTTMALSFAARAVLHAARNADSTTEALGSPAWLDLTLAAYAGALVALVFVVWLSLQTAGLSALWPHLGLGAAAVAVALVAYALALPVVRFAGYGLAAGLALMTLYSGVIHPARVLASATQVANGADHCISLPNRQRAAHSRGDLTFLTFDKSPRWSHQPHAALVTSDGPTSFWSFHLARFNPQSVNPPLTYCDPRGQAGLSDAPDTPAVLVTLDDGLYRVPTAYDPLPTAGEHLAVALDPMTGAAAPFDGHSAWLAPGQAASVDYLVAEGAQSFAGPHGLRVLDMGASPLGASTTVIYFARTNGRVTTQIECWDLTCLHRFTPDGTDRIIFSHERIHLPVWRDMEDRVAGRFADWRL